MTQSSLVTGLTQLALAATLAVGGVLAVSAPASASTSAPASVSASSDPTAEVWERLSVYSNGLVAAVPSPYTTNDLQLQTATYAGVNAWYEQWMLHKVSNDTYTFENHYSHQCLDTENGGSLTAGTPVVQRPCDSTPSQNWVFSHDAVLPVWHITNQWSGLSLAVANGSASAGAGFIQANNKPNITLQMFQMW